MNGMTSNLFDNPTYEVLQHVITLVPMYFYFYFY